MIAFELAPELGQLLDFFSEVSLFRGEKDGVDRAGRNAGDDLETQIGKMPGEASEKTDLIGGAGPAAFTCFLAELSWESYLRIDQNGGTIAGYMSSPSEPAPEDGYLIGHVDSDGALVVDHTRCLKDRCPTWPQVSGWRTVLSQDGATLSGPYGDWWGIYESYMPRKLTMQRVE